MKYIYIIHIYEPTRLYKKIIIQWWTYLVVVIVVDILLLLKFKNKLDSRFPLYP